MPSMIAAVGNSIEGHGIPSGAGDFFSPSHFGGKPMITADSQNRYLELVRQFPLRPIHSEEEYERGLEMIETLLSQDQRTPDEDDYIAVLSSLVEAYEDRDALSRGVSEADVLRHLIEARGVSQSQVAADTGIAVSTISEILSERRRLNRDHITALARYFHVPPSVFLG